MNVTSTRLRYDGQQRVAHFEGRTVMHSPERTLEADRADVYLTAPAARGSASPGRMEKIVAEGSIRLQEPGRSGQGEHLVYTAAEQKYVLTGTESNPSSIFDAEHGNVTGASLTFFFHDDRVLVSSVSNSRSITTTRIKSAPR